MLSPTYIWVSNDPLRIFIMTINSSFLMWRLNDIHHSLEIPPCLQDQFDNG